MNKSNIICPICSKEYNGKERLPRILQPCNHTVCSACLMSYLVDDVLLCPLDGTQIPTEGKGLEILCPNYELKRIVEKKNDPSFCVEHNESMTFLCMQDNHLICNKCQRIGAHRGHQVTSLEDLTDEANEKLERLDQGLTQYDDYCKEVERVFENSKKNLLGSVKEAIQNLRWLLFMKEQQLLNEIITFFDNEKEKIKESFGRNSKERMRLASDINELTDMIENNSWKANYKEYFDSLSSKFEMNNESSQRIKFLQDNLKEVSEEFESSLFLKVQPFIVLLDFPVEDFSSKAEVVYFDEDESLPSKKLHMVQSISENMRSSHDKSAILLNEQQLEDIRVNTSRYNLIPNLNELNETVSSIWKQFRDSCSFKIDFNSRVISDREIFDCFLFADWSAPALSKFEISLKNSNIREYSIIPLVSEILPKMDMLQVLRIDLNNTRITDRSLAAFFKKTLPGFGVLEELELILSKTDISDNTIIDFCSNPKNFRNMKKLLLNLDSTQVTNEGVICLARTSMNSMQELELDLSNTKITDQSIVELSRGVRALKKLSLNLSWTKVSNNSVDALMIDGLPFMKAMESLRLYFWGTPVLFETINRLFTYLHQKKNLEAAKLTEKSIEVTSKYPLSIQPNLDKLEVDLTASAIGDHVIGPFFQNMHTVSHYTLILGNTNVGNNSIQEFVRKTLVSMRNLEYLELNLTATAITDEGIQSLASMRVNTLKTLIVDLSETRVTDLAADIILNNALYTLRNLNRFELTVNNTRVTDDKKRQIQDIQNQLNRQSSSSNNL